MTDVRREEERDHRKGRRSASAWSPPRAPDGVDHPRRHVRRPGLAKEAVGLVLAAVVTSCASPTQEPTYAVLSATPGESPPSVFVRLTPDQTGNALSPESVEVVSTATGRPVRRLVDGLVDAATLGPSGRYLYYAIAQVEEPGHPRTPDLAFRVPVTGGPPQPLGPLAGALTPGSQVYASADDTRLAYATQTGGFVETIGHAADTRRLPAGLDQPIGWTGGAIVLESLSPLFGVVPGRPLDVTATFSRLDAQDGTSVRIAATLSHVGVCDQASDAAAAVGGAVYVVVDGCAGGPGGPGPTVLRVGPDGGAPVVVTRMPSVLHGYHAAGPGALAVARNGDVVVDLEPTRCDTGREQLVVTRGDGVVTRIAGPVPRC